MHTPRHRSTARRNAGFTLVELLVVIAIIAVMVSLLLPAIARSRDAAKRVTCTHKMKGIFVMATAFQGDLQAILPAWYYALRPEGPYIGENPGLGHPIFGWSYNQFGHMLIDYGYVSRGQRIPTTSTFSAMRKLAASSPFTCPNAYYPTGANDDNPADFLTGAAQTDPNSLDSRRCRLARTWTSYNSNGGNGMFWGSYNINMNAGSFSWYHNASVNYGFYPRKQWTRTPHDKIAYLFESSEFGVDENHMATAYSRTVNVWGVGGWGGNYCPVRTHANDSESNLLYFDGHLDTLLGDYTGKAFPFSWY